MGSTRTRAGTLDVQAIIAAWGEPIAGIVLVGSAARGEEWDTSDVDLLIVLPAGPAVVRELCDRWDRHRSPVFRLAGFGLSG